MAKQLFLLRHAQSVDKQPGQGDKERELTPTGIKESLLIGSFLLKQKKNIEIIYSSTATRAQSTASLICDGMRIEQEKVILEEELYTASVRTFFEFICQIDNSYNQIMCVGHNPTISYLGEYLTRAEIGDMPPAGLVVIRFDLDSWRKIDQGNGEFVLSMTPAMIESEING